jgi:hypothetical protein
VSVDDVRDVVNINSADIPDNRILKMVKRAEVVEKMFKALLKPESS